MPEPPTPKTVPHPHTELPQAPRPDPTQPPMLQSIAPVESDQDRPPPASKHRHPSDAGHSSAPMHPVPPPPDSQATDLQTMDSKPVYLRTTSCPPLRLSP